MTHFVIKHCIYIWKFKVTWPTSQCHYYQQSMTVVPPVLHLDYGRRQASYNASVHPPHFHPSHPAHMKTNTEAWRTECGVLRSGVINSPHKQASVQSPARHPSLHSHWTVWTSLSDLSALCRHHPGWQPLNWLQPLSHWNSIYVKVSMSS